MHSSSKPPTRPSFPSSALTRFSAIYTCKPIYDYFHCFYGTQRPLSEINKSFFSLSLSLYRLMNARLLLLFTFAPWAKRAQRASADPNGGLLRSLERA